MTYGRTTSSGKIGVGLYIDDSTATIVYDRTTDSIEYVFSNSNMGSVLQIIFKPSNDDANTRYLMVYGGLYGEAYAVFDISSYTINTNLNYKVTKTNLSNSEYVDLANQFTRSAMSGLNYLLLSQLGITLNDIGFGSFGL